jgi:hypothetical protein
VAGKSLEVGIDGVDVDVEQPGDEGSGMPGGQQE